MGKGGSTSFIDIVKETDPDCFLYNFARQGELDFGMVVDWNAARNCSNRVFHCFEEHKRYVESRFKAIYVRLWEPESECSIKDEVASMYLEAAKAMHQGEIFGADQDDVVSALSDLRIRFDVSIRDIVAHRNRLQH